MKNDIGVLVAAGVRFAQSVFGNIAKPGQRVPVCNSRLGEYCRNGINGRIRNPGIVRDVGLIVPGQQLVGVIARVADP